MRKTLLIATALLLALAIAPTAANADKWPNGRCVRNMNVSSYNVTCRTSKMISRRMNAYAPTRFVITNSRGMRLHVHCTGGPYIISCDVTHRGEYGWVNFSAVA